MKLVCLKYYISLEGGGAGNILLGILYLQITFMLTALDQTILNKSQTKKNIYTKN